MGPGDLQEILKGLPQETDPRLLVGASTADDAGVFKLTDELALIQTVDFFTPMVNDPYLFGQIAAANALSDVYAMGGAPLTAMNICCFPVEEAGFDFLRQILAGGQDKVREAGAVLAGGHSVKDDDLKYGLSVTGVVHPDRVVTNAGLVAGQVLILTKPLGTGIIATALKGRLVSPETVAHASRLMAELNKPAARVMAELGVTGATDITGFGLLGHGLELAKASGVGLEIVARDVPVLPEAKEMAAMGMVPAGGHSNRNFCGHLVEFSGRRDAIMVDILADPQTSGGMLMGVDQGKADRALAMLAGDGVAARVVGRVLAEPAGRIRVRF